jgi:hypothetical protein
MVTPTHILLNARNRIAAVHFGYLNATSLRRFLTAATVRETGDSLSESTCETPCSAR